MSMTENLTKFSATVSPFDGKRHFVSKTSAFKGGGYGCSDLLAIELLNIHFIGSPDVTKKGKPNKSRALEAVEVKPSPLRVQFAANGNQQSGPKGPRSWGDSLGLDQLGRLSPMDRAQTHPVMKRQRSQSMLVTEIESKKHKLSDNTIRSIQIAVNRHKFKVMDLTEIIAARFQIPWTSKILLTYHNYMLSVETESIAYYGIQNHSCLLLSVSEAPTASKRKKGPSVRKKRAMSNEWGQPTAPPPSAGTARLNSLDSGSARTRPRVHSQAVSADEKDIEHYLHQLRETRKGRKGRRGRRGRRGHKRSRSAGPERSDEDGIGRFNGMRFGSAIFPLKTNALVPGSKIKGAVSLTQSESKAARGGLYSILNDTSKSRRERENLFTKRLDIERVTDLDIYSFDLDSNCFAMGCGHGMPKETLFAFAAAQMKSGALALECPHLRNPSESDELCKAPWPMQAVRKVLLSGESPRIPLGSKNDATRRTPKWELSLFGLIVFGFMRCYELRRFAPSVLLLIYQFVLDKKQEAEMMRHDVKRMMKIEIECAKNKFVDTFDYQKCPRCTLFIHRSKGAMNKKHRVSQCPFCRTKFRWICDGV